MRLTTALACTTLFFAGTPKRGQAAVSPATSNCVDNNFTDQILYEPDGGQYGICVFSNETACEEWTFLRSECNVTNPNFALYCADNGGQISVENVDWGEVQGAPPAEYEVCTTSNGGQCTDWDYYGLNNCSLASVVVGDSSNPSMDDICAAKGGASRLMGTVDGSDYSICSFGINNACELGKLMRGECDETNPNLISFCAEKGGSVSLGGVEPLEYEVCTVGKFECIEEHYYLYDNCTMTKEVDPPGNDSCSSAVPLSSFASIPGSVVAATADEWSLDPTCGFLQVPPGEGVWYTFTDVKVGMKLKVACSNMDCMLLSSNFTLGECPSKFLCPNASVGRGENNALLYDFTTEEGGIYYIYFAPKPAFPGPEYFLTVEGTFPSPPTPGPTSIVSSTPVSGAAAGSYLGALFSAVLFAAMYFSV